MPTVTTSEGETLDLPILHVVDKSRAGRKLAIALGVLIVIVPFLLAFTPWQQNVGGTGRVTVVEPDLRIREIPAPITGRLVKTFVQEGSVVKKGDTLVRMEDQDSGFFDRLKLDQSLSEQQIDILEKTVGTYTAQIEALLSKQVADILEAEAELESAVQKILEAENKLLKAQAKRVEKEQDLKRNQEGFESGVFSERELQEAQADYDSAVAEEKAAKAGVDGALANEKAKEAKIRSVGSDATAKIEEVRSKRQDTETKIRKATQELQEKLAKVSRQSTQEVLAPEDGRILAILGAANQDLISKGSPLITFVPSGGTMAVEMFMRGIDAPLISQGRKSRLVFEGWPAVQFAGWPSVAVGTFGGVVSFIEPQAGPDGRVRVLILPDPEEDIPWPDTQFLRQGVRVSGWVQLDTVSVGYEIWRQLNAFPPSIQIDPTTMTKEGKDKGKGKADKGSKKESGL